MSQYARKLQERSEEIWLSVFLQDNDPAHTAQAGMTAATECVLEILPHPQNSPDMAPSDFYLFPKLKSHLRGTQYGSNEGVIETVNE